jgi:hypothetical protein
MNDDQPKLIFTADFPLKMCQRKREKQKKISAEKMLFSICTDCCCSVADFLSV